MPNLRACSVIVALVAAVACKPNVKTEGTTAGLYEKGAGWPGSTVEICFSERGSGTPELHKFVRSILEEEINAKTRFRFTGFNVCSKSPNSNVEVVFVDRSAEWKGKADIGAKQDWLRSTLSHLIPNYHARNKVSFALSVPAIPGTNSWGAVDQASLQGTILHEFGHVLGLHHEYYRSDNQEGVYCKDKYAGAQNQIPNAVQVGKYDTASVMNNFCHESWGRRFVSLSKGDVATINTLYPTGSGANQGYRLRCESMDRLKECFHSDPLHGIGLCYQKYIDPSQIRECIATCVASRCTGGDVVCENADSLIACAKAEGGYACLDSNHGKCR